MKIQCALIFLLLTGARFSSAFVTDETDRFELNFGVELPFYVGVQTRYNINTEYYAKISAGFAMQIFMRSQQQILESVLGFNETRAGVIQALSNSFIVDMRAGWTANLYEEGPYLELGYGLMAWGSGQMDAGRMYEIFQFPPADLEAENIHTHIFHHGPLLAFGYAFVLTNKLSLSLGMSVYKPLFSYTELEYSEGAVSAVDSENNLSVKEQEIFNNLDENSINGFIVKQLFFTSLDLWFGLRF